MPINVARLNAMLDTEFVAGDLLCLHTANPGTTVGASEASGGGYARQALAYGAAAAGVKAMTGTEVFSVAAGTYTHWSIINSGATVVKASGALSASETFAAAGTYTCTALSLTIT